jgi:hypothetical protein
MDVGLIGHCGKCEYVGGGVLWYGDKAGQREMGEELMS